MALTDAQKRAQKKYNEKNKNKRKTISYRNSAKMFIRRFASDESLDELEELIKERRRINLLLSDLDGVRAFINNKKFLDKNGLEIKIWRRPEDLLKDRLQKNDEEKVVEKWFAKKIEEKFSKEEPIVEIKKAGKSKFYDSFRGYDILDWLNDQIDQ